MLGSLAMSGLRRFDQPALLAVASALLALPFLVDGLLGIGDDSPRSEFPLAVAVAALAALLASRPIRIGSFARLSAMDVPLVAALVILPSGDVVLAAAAARLAAGLIGRQGRVRLLRGTAAAAISLGTAGYVLGALTAALAPLGPGGRVPAALAAATLYVLLDMAQTVLLIEVTGHRGVLASRSGWWGTIGSTRLLTALFAVGATLVVRASPLSLLAVAPVFALGALEVRARLRAERRVRLLATLLDTGRALGSTLDPADVFRAVHAQVSSVMDADGFYVAVADRGRNVLCYRYLADAAGEYPPTERPFEGTTAGLCVRRGEPIHMRDALRDRLRYGLGKRQTFGAAEERSLIVAPLRIRGEVIGAISAQSIRPAAYDDGDLELLVAIANEAAVALERADLHERSARLSKRLFELHRVGMELAGYRELSQLTQALVDSVRREVGAASAALYLDAGGELLEHAASASSTHEAPPWPPTLSRRSPPGGFQLDLERILDVPDSEALPQEARRVLEGFGRRALVIQPLRAAEQFVGLLFLAWDEPHELEATERDLVGVLVGVGATSIRSVRLYRELDDAYVSTVAALTAMIEARDHYREDHQRRVAADAIALGERLGLSELTMRDLRYAALFHALGKIAVPAAILGKEGPLTPEERALVREHPLLGARILESIPFLRGVVSIVKHANERWDGSGYPSRLSASDIPYPARILQIALSYEAMLADRPYRPALPQAVALAELRALAGVRYDPVLVVEFTRMIEARGAIAAAEEHLSAATARELAVLGQIMPEFHQLLDVQTLLDRVLAILERHLPGAFFTIFLADETTDDLVVRAARGARADLAGPMRLPAGRGIAGWVLEHREPQIVDDVWADPRYVGDTAIRSELSVPLISNGRGIGVITVDHPSVGAFSARDLTLLQTVGAQIAAAIDVAELHERLKRAANTDALTGIHNYGYFYQRLEEEVARAERRNSPLAVAFFDIDGLKQVNDTHGHLAGNAVLRALGQAVEANVRTEDVPARYGGDEFAIVMPDTPREEAEKVVQRLMDALDHSEVELEGGRRIPMPPRSWGVAAYPLDGRDARSLVDNADTRSYARKRSRS